jgi:hypothetical protein
MAPPDPSSCSQVSRNRQAIRQVLRESNIQPKLAVGSEDDVQRGRGPGGGADHAHAGSPVSDRINRTDVKRSSVRGRCGSSEKPEGVTPWISCKAEGAEVGSDIESGMNALKGGGQPLSSSARSFFEPRFGYDFGGVRVHRDARGLNCADPSAQGLSLSAGTSVLPRIATLTRPPQANGFLLMS